MSDSFAWARTVVDCFAREAGVNPAYVRRIVFESGEIKPTEVLYVEIEGQEQTGITLRVKAQRSKESVQP